MRIEPVRLRDLVERAQEGDAEAFTLLVESFEQPVYALALQKLGHPEDAQDVAQDAFLEAFRTIEKLQEPEAFPAWIRRITLSFAFQRLRKRQRRPEVLVGGASEIDAVAAAGFPEVNAMELPGLVLKAISRVAEAYQFPLMLRYLEKLTPQQIAAELGMNPNTVRVTLHRGSALLRKHLEEVLRERES
jgi:RNA polymerase sigma-70 factor (ECF subfamily)